MESIRELYRIGYGPSSSHTMGPRAAAESFGLSQPGARSFRVTLYGSLASTGKGHLTDIAIIEALKPRQCEIAWRPDEIRPVHTNSMKMEALDGAGKTIASQDAYSVGGGKLIYDPPLEKPADGANPDGAFQGSLTSSIYELSSMAAILEHTEKTGQTLWEYVEEREGSEIWQFLAEVWLVMGESVERGLVAEGLLPGGLGLQRKASGYFVKANSYRGSLKRRTMLFAFALAVAEENAAGGKIVTAPTCGSCGVLPGVLYGLSKNYGFPEEKILRALATAGLIGTIVKRNASISGAAVGCQGEIGVACSMAAGAAAQLFGGTPHQIEYAAEMGLEHHLGLTCDPICGLVQVPCIERNAFAASRALDANTFALLSDGRHLICFDTIVETMNRTGNDLPRIYKETSEGGLAVTARRF